MKLTTQKLEGWDYHMVKAVLQPFLYDPTI